MLSFESLNTTAIRRVIQGIQDARTLPMKYSRWSSRVNKVPALPGEILARIVGRSLIADMVPDDAPARTSSYQRVQLYTHDVPNIKRGQRLSQEELNLFSRLAQNLAGKDEVGYFTQTRARIFADLMDGVEARVNHLVLSMMLDSTYVYDNNFGAKINVGTWGMPGTLNTTVSTAWLANPTTATPVQDIITLKTTARILFDEDYDRIDMSTSAFQAMISTTEYQNKARPYLFAGALSLGTNWTSTDLKFQSALATNVLGVKELNLCDERVWYQAEDGQVRNFPFLPLNKVLLSSTSDDNNNSAWDFAQDVVTESLVAQFAGGANVPGMSAVTPQRGPFGFATIPPDLNPPNVSMWVVDRGFPRKHRLSATAVIDCGPIAEAYPTYDPYA